MTPYARISEEAPLTTRLITTADGFDALRPAWESLFEAGDGSVFQSYEWQRTWWKYFGEGNPDASLSIILIEHEKKPVCIAPFFVQTLCGPRFLSLRRLVFIGHDTSDYLDLLCLPGEIPAAADTLGSRLLSLPILFDLVLLENIPERSPTSETLRQSFERTGIRCMRYVNECCPGTKLASTWDEMLTSFSGNLRGSVQRKSKKMERKYAVRYEIFDGSTPTDEAMNDLMALHQERWSDLGEEGTFASRQQISFHSEVARLFAKRGWLWMAFLRLNEERVAAQYHFRHRKTQLYYQGGTRINPETGKFSPGLLLHLFSMSEAIKDGMTTYDLLRGTERYKYELGGIDKKNMGLLLFNPAAQAIRVRYRLFLFYSSTRERMLHEKRLLDETVRTNGLVSQSTLEHVVARGRIFVQRAMRKLRPSAD